MKQSQTHHRQPCVGDEYKLKSGNMIRVISVHHGNVKCVYLNADRVAKRGEFAEFVLREELIQHSAVLL